MNRFSRLFQRTTNRPQTRRIPAPRPASRFRAYLEVMEDRTVPSTFYAATAADLIQDIQAANQQGGANTIVLTAPASSSYALPAVQSTTNEGATVLPQVASGDNLTIRTGNGTATPGYGDVLDAGKNGRLFDIAAGGSLTLQNVTLQNGREFAIKAGTITTQQGGAICNHGTLVLSQVMVQNCAVAGWPSSGAAAAGGGIWSEGSLTVENASVFQGNSATGSNVFSSYARGGNAYGGAICIAGGTASLTDTLLGLLNLGGGNSAVGGTGNGGGTAYGGAVYVAAGTVTMSGDTVGSGAQGFNSLVPNVARSAGFNPSYGGGICVAGGTVTLTEDTIHDNSAGGNGSMGHGGGIYIAPGATVDLDSFTLAHAVGNHPSNIVGTYTLLP